jgi:hypothetical protein
MNGSFDSHPRNFGELLGQYEKRPLNVPQFQRGYSWEKSHVATCWDDLKTFRETKPGSSAAGKYFLGPIVIIPEPDEQILLDGQQRLATATILFAVIRDLARIEIATDKAKDLARDIQRDLISKDEDEGLFALNLGELDQDFFRKSVQSDPPVNTAVTLRSHRAIQSAKQYLRTAVLQIIEGKKADEQVKVLKALKETVATDLVTVAITVDSEDNAYRIFETLNDRGLRLSVPDLLLNFLMRNAENATQRNSVRNTWNVMLEKMGRRDIDRFLRHMWLSKYGDLKARGLFHEIKDYIHNKKMNSVAFAEVCSDECTSYLSIVEPDAKVLGKAYSHVVGLVKYLQIQPAVPLLLAGLRTLQPQAFEKLSRSVASIALRHSVIANLNPSDLESAFYESGRMLRVLKAKGATNAKALHDIRTVLAKVNPDDATVLKSFDELHLNKPEAQYMLGTIANTLQSKTKEIAIDTPTVEHIYPESPGLHWAQSDVIPDYLWHIGNLTLLGKKLNEKTANLGFLEKQKGYASSEIELTRRIAKDFASWNRDDVLKRAAMIGKQAVNIWTF